MIGLKSIEVLLENYFWKEAGRSKDFWHRRTQALPLPKKVRDQKGDHLSESQWNRCHFRMAKWESEKHKSWGMPAEGFKGHVATVGYLLGTAGMSGACGWSVVQLDYSDEELGPLHRMYGSMEVELEVQRIIKRAEVTAFLCLLKKVIGAITVHVDKAMERRKKMQKSESRRCRFVDGDLGRTAQSCSRRYCGGSGTKKGKKDMSHFRMCRADVLVKELGTARKATFGRTRYGKKNGQTGRSSDLVWKNVQNM